MCYACSAGEDGGPVGARDWLNWFRFWFRPHSLKHTGASATHLDTVHGELGHDDASTASPHAAKVVPIDLSSGL